MKFWETFGNLAFIIRARVEGLRDMGPALSPFNSFLFSRVSKHCNTVWRPLPQRPGSRRASAEAPRRDLGQLCRTAVEPVPRAGKEVLPNGAGAVLTFGIKGGLEAGKKLID